MFVIAIGTSLFRSSFKLCVYLSAGSCCRSADCAVDGFIGIVVCSSPPVRVCA